MKDKRLEELKSWRAERNEVLLSLDEVRIRHFVAKYKLGGMSTDPEVFWRAVHKARTGCMDLPIEARRLSKAWLKTHYSEPWDDGEL